MELMRFLPVRALPKPERLRYLFSFDFDDTLFTLGGPAEERSIFFRTMRMLRSQYGVLWGVNTGRDPVYLRKVWRICSVMMWKRLPRISR